MCVLSHDIPPSHVSNRRYAVPMLHRKMSLQTVRSLGLELVRGKTSIYIDVVAFFQMMTDVGAREELEHRFRRVIIESSLYLFTNRDPVCFYWTGMQLLFLTI